jgi:hypothetical protein
MNMLSSQKLFEHGTALENKLENHFCDAMESQSFATQRWITCTSRQR